MNEVYTDLEQPNLEKVKAVPKTDKTNRIDAMYFTIDYLTSCSDRVSAADLEKYATTIYNFINK